MTKSDSGQLKYSIRISLTLGLMLIFFFILSSKQSNSQQSNKDIVLQTQTIKDIDGNIYPIVTIGKQTWMAENLKTTKYNDGTNIPLVTDDKKMQEFTPAYCWYNNDETANKSRYGALYNWYAVELINSVQMAGMYPLFQRYLRPYSII